MIFSSGSEEGSQKKAIRQDLQESNLANDVIDSVLEKAEEDNSVKFWTMSSKGVVKAIPLIFKKFLEMNGFFKILFLIIYKALKTWLCIIILLIRQGFLRRTFCPC